MIGEDGHQVVELRMARLIVKYGIVCMAILGGLHNVINCIGEGLVLVLMVLVSGLGVLLGRVFGFCLTYSLCLVYGVASVVLMELEVLLGITIDAMRYGLACSGILLIIVALWMARAH